MKPASSGRSKTSRRSVWTSASMEGAVSTAECPSAGTCPWLAPRTSGRAIAGGSPGFPSGERIVSPAIWITARNITNGISSSLTGIQQERGRSAAREAQPVGELASDGPSGVSCLPSSRAKMSQEGEDQGVDTPGQEPRQGQWNLSNCGDKPLLHRHFRQEGRPSLIPGGAALIAGRTLFFFGAGQYNLRFAHQSQEASQTHPANSCRLRGLLDSGRWDCPDRKSFGPREERWRMYAIIEDGSHQFSVSEGDHVRVDRRDGKAGDE